jgi:hypothetical protein
MGALHERARPAAVPSHAMATTLEPPRAGGRDHPSASGPDPEGAPAPGGPPRRDRSGIPAGKVLAIGLVGLVLGALLNADSLVEQAERKPFGWSRDLSLAVWEPLAAVSHALALDRPRLWIDDLTGRADDGAGELVLPTAPGARPATDADGPTAAPPAPLEPELRTPTAAEPMRLWVGGDSMSQVFGESLVRLAADTGVVDTTFDYRISTGLTRPDYFDWPAHLAAEVERLDPEAMVVMFGANDAQGIVTPEGDVFQPLEPGWVAEYRRRVAATMDLLRDDDRIVWWVGQPVMRSADFSARMAGLNQIYADEAATRPWVRFVDTFPLFSDETGAYEAFLPDDTGTVEDLRQGDGIHLSRAGGDRLASHVLDRITAEAGVGG